MSPTFAIVPTGSFNALLVSVDDTLYIHYKHTKTTVKMIYDIETCYYYSYYFILPVYLRKCFKTFTPLLKRRVYLLREHTA